MSTGELIIDSFAGGGGASFGIELALGRSPDIAINHDAEAIALHKANHPTTEHFNEDVWTVDPLEATKGRRIGLMWLSPDCKHFSKAKGGKPVSKRVRGLAWVAVRWAAAVKPRVIVLENVEEFQTWGPVLRATNKPCPDRKGKHFRAFVTKLRRLGYEVAWRELRACDYGSPTIRKRLFLVARCDGQPIVWPKPTHGKGTPNAWRSAAECIDWSLSCPSIFERSKPLAENTLKRIAAGLRRYVIESGKPFIVRYRGEPSGSAVSIDAPMPTVTANSFLKRPGGAAPIGLVSPTLTPFVMPLTHHGSDRGQSLNAPLATITGAHRGEQALITPVLVNTANGKTTGRGPNTWPMTEPTRTITASPGFAVVAPTLIQTGYGERDGQAPRALDLEKPLGTAVAGGVKHALVSAFLAKHYTAKEGQVQAASLFDPVPTVTAIDHSALVSSTLVALRGTEATHQHGDSIEQPLRTVSANGMHHAEVRAFLVGYYGNERDGGSLFEPMRTTTSKDHFGLVTVDGQKYEIADIGMRMLAPRELYRAQGFPDSYRIDIPFNGKPMTKTAQVRMVGNSVAPQVAAAIVRANVPDMALAESVA